MKKIQKHDFEPVSLLTVENGILELAIIPASHQPDWLVPKSLILSIHEYQERIWTYLWQGQEVSVYHLCAKDEQADKLIVLEGNSDVHRLALQTTGEVRYISTRISDVKDVELSDDIKREMMERIPNLIDESHKLDYMYQAVKIDNKTYIVPELDLIAHQLVDLDS